MPHLDLSVSPRVASGREKIEVQCGSSICMKSTVSYRLIIYLLAASFASGVCADESVRSPSDLEGQSGTRVAKKRLRSPLGREGQSGGYAAKRLRSTSGRHAGIQLPIPRDELLPRIASIKRLRWKPHREKLVAILEGELLRSPTGDMYSLGQARARIEQLRKLRLTPERLTEMETLQRGIDLFTPHPGKLPLELVDKIAGHLCGRDIGNLRRVSRAYRWLFTGIGIRQHPSSVKLKVPLTDGDNPWLLANEHYAGVGLIGKTISHLYEKTRSDELTDSTAGVFERYELIERDADPLRDYVERMVWFATMCHSVAIVRDSIEGLPSEFRGGESSKASIPLTSWYWLIFFLASIEERLSDQPRALFDAAGRAVAYATRAVSDQKSAVIELVKREVHTNTHIDGGTLPRMYALFQFRLMQELLCEGKMKAVVDHLYQEAKNSGLVTADTLWQSAKDELDDLWDFLALYQALNHGNVDAAEVDSSNKSWLDSTKSLMTMYLSPLFDRLPPAAAAL